MTPESDRPLAELRRLLSELIDGQMDEARFLQLQELLRDNDENQEHYQRAMMVHALLHLDLAPGWDLPRLVAELSQPRGRRSLSGHVQSRIGLKGAKMALLREIVPEADLVDPQRLAAAIKALPLKLVAPRPLAEAISTAGGVAFDALDEHLMIRAMPGVFCAGEMLDWEAPTGGYLLTACFASGRLAACRDGPIVINDAETTWRQLGVQVGQGVHGGLIHVTVQPQNRELSYLRIRQGL
jgi:hypothetical protein